MANLSSAKEEKLNASNRPRNDGERWDGRAALETMLESGLRHGGGRE